MSRKYIKIDEYGKQIPEMKAQGKPAVKSHRLQEQIKSTSGFSHPDHC